MTSSAAASASRALLQSRKMREGQRVSASTINALIDAVSDGGVPRDARGFVEQSGEVRRRGGRIVDALSWMRCEADANYAAYSILEVYDGYLDEDGIVLQVRAPTAEARRYAVNEANAIAGGRGWVKLVTSYEPVVVRCVGDPQFYAAVRPLGVLVTSGQGPIDLAIIATRDSDNHVKIIQDRGVEESGASSGASDGGSGLSSGASDGGSGASSGGSDGGSGGSGTSSGASDGGSGASSGASDGGSGLSSGASDGGSGLSSGASDGGSGASSGGSDGGSGASSGGSDGGSGASSGASGSEKSTAIVPVPKMFCWTGYTALYVLECPDPRFDDVVVAEIEQVDGAHKIDPLFLCVCEPSTVEVCGQPSCDEPVLIGARSVEGLVRVRFAEQRPGHVLRVVIRLSGIRRGFAEPGIRFGLRTGKQYWYNELHINSAYPSFDANDADWTPPS